MFSFILWAVEVVLYTMWYGALTLFFIWVAALVGMFVFGALWLLTSILKSLNIIDKPYGKKAFMVCGAIATLGYILSLF